MDDFLAQRQSSEIVSSKQFIIEYFDWCKINDRPRTPVTREVLEVVGPGRIIGIPKKE
jgi:hypothetical protein